MKNGGFNINVKYYDGLPSTAQDIENNDFLDTDENDKEAIENV